MADDGKGFWQSAPGLLTGAAAVIAAVTGLVVALKPIKATPTPAAEISVPAAPTSAGPTPAPVAQTPAVQNQQQAPAAAQMGPLEFGVGYEGNDLHPKGTLLLGSAQACANRCYDSIECKAMTYIRSARRCWLKSAAGNRVEASDEVSAVKR